MRAAFFSTIILLASGVAASAITINTVPVGKAGNGADATGYGAVPYEYRIGTTEITNTQYAAFLNAKAASDPLALYDVNMSDGFGGIARSGADGSYTYTPIAGRANMPVVYVNWFDSLRFVNWLNNGQGTGDTETGAYTLLGGKIVPTNAATITRNSGASWFLPSENEWYKAAYFNPATNSYFSYPTSSNSSPAVQSPPGGNNSANYWFAVNDLTSAGAYSNSPSPVGTYDQGGNVWEWNEALNNSFRAIRGGSWNDIPAFLTSSVRGYSGPADSGTSVGFRVATIPEPGTMVLAAVGLVALVGVAVRRRCVKVSNAPSTAVGPRSIRRNRRDVGISVHGRM